MLRVNNLEQLPLYLEHDQGYVGLDCTQEEIADIGDIEIVLCQPGFPKIKGVLSIEVIDNYCLNLSPGQLKLYEMLLAMQKGSTRAFTNIYKLTEALDLVNPLATATRLQHLNDLGAIHGFKL